MVRALIFCLALALMGCGKDDGGSAEPATANTLAGTSWSASTAMCVVSINFMSTVAYDARIFCILNQDTRLLERTEGSYALHGTQLTLSPVTKSCAALPAPSTVEVIQTDTTLTLGAGEPLSKNSALSLDLDKVVVAQLGCFGPGGTFEAHPMSP